jgi:hypothetical protein
MAVLPGLVNASKALHPRAATSNSLDTGVIAGINVVMVFRLLLLCFDSARNELSQKLKTEVALSLILENPTGNSGMYLGFSLKCRHG